MNVSGIQESFLLAQFRRFYAEVVRLKGLIQSPGSESSPEHASASPPAVREPSPEAIQQELLSTIERQALQAEQRGGAFAYEVYREAQYVFVALADEVFLNLNWSGSKSWPLLESRLFQSHRAGELFFEKLDALLAKRNPAYRDLAAVYFMALALGFKGKYRGGDESPLDHYRHELFLTIFERSPHLFEEDVSLFPQSYLHTLREGSRKRLPDPRNWLALIPVVLLAWLIISTMLWNRATRTTDLTLQKIQTAPTQLSREGP